MTITQTVSFSGMMKRETKQKSLLIGEDMYSITIDPDFEYKRLFRNKTDVWEFLMYETLTYPEHMQTFEDYVDFLTECVSIEYRTVYLGNT